MNISEAARRSGLSAKTIRYYEEIALIEPAERGGNGYRVYDGAAVEELQFLARAREVGFDLDECRQLLALHRDPARQSRHARVLVLEKSRMLQQRIEQLATMQQVLEDLATRCSGDEGPECAILDKLAGSTALNVDEVSEGDAKEGPCGVLKGDGNSEHCPVLVDLKAAGSEAK